MNKFNSQKGYLVPLLIAVVVILIAGGIYLAMNKKTGSTVGNPNATSTLATNDQKIFTNSQYGFAVSYPKSFSVSETHDSSFYNEMNIYELSINAPSDYQKGTDFDMARIFISVSSSTAMCYTKSTDGVIGFDLPNIKTVNGISFHYAPPHGDAAIGGQRGTFSLFATIKNGQCYRIEKLVVYRDSRGFADPPYPPHFDEQTVNAELDKIVSSFKFTN